MLDFLNPKFWFQKRTSAMDDARVRMEQMSQYNALFHLDPDKIVSAITQYNAGSIGPLAHIIRDLEQHDDKMATCSMKMKASVGRCDWSVQIKDGFADDERAKRHAEILKRFWSTVCVTDRFKMNERGGLRLLKKQMMEAQSYGFAVHEIVWKPLANGEISAEFIKLPLWNFENRTGALRFLPSTTATDGVPMAAGEWLVTTGDGVGIPAAICAMAKRMSFQDWLLFSERSGMPIIVGKTGATFKSDQWNNIKAAIRSIYRDSRVLLDSASDITAIDTGHAANIPFPPLVEWSDRAIAACYRGADLSTISKGDGTGASLQGDEAGMIEQDAAENLSESLHKQVDAFVIRYVTGDDEPLAKISIEPATKTDVDTDIKIDNHLVSMGCRLSKSDMMTRYGRTEATSDDDVAELKKPLGDSAIGGLGDFGRTLPNEKPLGDLGIGGLGDFNQSITRLHNKAPNPPIIQSPNHEILSAFAKDMSPAGKAVAELLQDPSKEAAEALLAKLDTLLPEDPETAAVISEAMVKEFGATMANEVQRIPSGNGNGGQFTGKTNQPTGTTKEPHDKGFQDKYGNGNPETLAADPKMNVERGKAVISRIMGKKEGYEPHAMYRKDVGWIGVDYGTPGAGKNFDGGHGISHVVSKHPGAIDGVVDILQNGTAYKHDESKRKIYLIKDRTAVVLSKSRENRLLITDFENLSDTQMKEYTSKGLYHAKGEN